MLSSLGDIVCTSIIEIIEIFRALVRLLKISAKTRRGRGKWPFFCQEGASSISREGRFLSYLSNRANIKRIDNA